MRQGGTDNDSYTDELLLVRKDHVSYSISCLDSLLDRLEDCDFDTFTRLGYVFYGRLSVLREVHLIDSEDVDRYIKALCRVWLQFQGGWSDVVA